VPKKGGHHGNFRRWTTKEIMILQENAGKHSDKELGDMLGRTYQSVRFMRYRLGLPPKRAVYEVTKGYEVLARGTAEECAKKLGVKPETIRYYASPSRYKKAKNVDNVTLATRLE